jgi:hypothetical protein
MVLLKLSLFILSFVSALGISGVYIQESGLMNDTSLQSMSLLTSPIRDDYDSFVRKICSVTGAEARYIRGRDVQCRYHFGSVEYAAYLLLIYSMEHLIGLK